MSADHIEVEGQVVDSCKGILIVEDAAGNRIHTRLSGKMRLNKIMVTVGDRVQVKVSPYDLENGFIIKRM
jgi:translation initiation factor IF-1